MSEICAMCGLPKALCVCDTIAKESQHIKISTIKKKFGKVNTIVEGLDPKEIDIKGVAKKMKSELACGGTVKKSVIELQGEHRQRAKKILIKLGFVENTIEVR